MGLSKGQKAVLHIAKAYLALDDDTYGDALEAHGGARSSKDLKHPGFLRVMKHFKACGFESKEKGARSKETKDRAGFATEAMIRKIYASWWALGGSYYKQGKELKALRGFLQRRFRVSHENFLTFGQGRKVIEAIKSISHRRTQTDTEKVQNEK